MCFFEISGIAGYLDTLNTGDISGFGKSDFESSQIFRLGRRNNKTVCSRPQTEILQKKGRQEVSRIQTQGKTDEKMVQTSASS